MQTCVPIRFAIGVRRVNFAPVWRLRTAAELDHVMLERTKFQTNCTKSKSATNAQRQSHVATKNSKRKLEHRCIADSLRLRSRSRSRRLLRAPLLVLLEVRRLAVAAAVENGLALAAAQSFRRWFAAVVCAVVCAVVRAAAIAAARRSRFRSGVTRFQRNDLSTS